MIKIVQKDVANFRGAYANLVFILSKSAKTILDYFLSSEQMKEKRNIKDC